jgi:uncharacterized protein (TIGR02678 family)
VIRREETELYNEIVDKKNEKALRKYFFETFRFTLSVEPDYVKLEKIPADPHAFMGIEKFSSSQDYVFFYLILAFLEEKHGRQFSLSSLCEFIMLNYPRVENNQNPKYDRQEPFWKVGWTTGSQGYINRMSLIRVLKEAKARYLIEEVDQDIHGFKEDATHDVLLRSTGMLRYFMRRFGYNINEAKCLRDIKELQEESEKALGLERRHYLYRKLLLEPVIYEHEVSSDDFEYLRKYGHTIQNHLEQWYDAELEVYSHTAMITQQEISYGDKVFPDGTAQSNIAVQISSLVRRKIKAGEMVPSKWGTLLISNYELERLFAELSVAKKSDWTTEFRDMSVKKLTEEMFSYLCNWKFADIKDENTVILYDTIGRVAEKE